MKKCFLASVLGLLPIAGYSTDLISLYDIAVAKDPTLHIAQDTRDSMATAMPQARGLLLPSVDLSANQSDGTKPNLKGINELNKLHGVNLSISQALLNFNAWYLYQQAEKTVESSAQDYIAAEQDLMIRVTQAYFNVLQAKETLHFKNAQKKALEKELEQVKQRLKVGLVAITDVSETQASFDNAVAETIQAINDLSSARMSLQEITNEYPRHLAELQRDLKLNLPTPSDEKVWIAKAREFNPALQSAKKMVDAAEHSLQAAKAANYPTMSISGGRSINRMGTVTNPNGRFDNTWNAMLTIDVNLFKGGSMMAKTDQAYYDRQKAVDNLEKVERATVKATSIAYRNVVTAISRAKALKQAVLSSRTALKATQAAYDVGTRTSVDVLNNITALYSNEQRYAEARHSYVVSELLLKRAAGLLTVADLQEVNALLNPQNVNHAQFAASTLPGDAKPHETVASSELPPIENQLP